MFRRLSSRVKKFWAGVALLSVEMVIVLGLFVISLVTFIVITRRIFYLNKTKFDNDVFDYLQDHVSPRNNEIMLFFTYLGRHEFLIPANLILIAYFLFIKKHKWYSIKVPAIALSSLALMFILKNIFDRPRPSIPLLEEAKGLSFPSGHALMSVTFYGLIIYILWKTIPQKGVRYALTGLLLLLILIIGFSRIYLRVHYASDVLAGLCIGFLWLVFAVWLLNQMEHYSKQKLDHVVREPVTTA
jgi:undecaprenyl-diphosphatase